VEPIPEPKLDVPTAARTERFEAAYRSLYAPVGAYVLRRVSAAEEAAEVIAETFLTLWRRFDDAPTGEALRPWTYGIARRVIANHLRGERRRSGLTERLVTDVARVTGRLPDPADAVVERSRLRAALARLSETDQELLRLVAWEGLATDEIAIVLGVRSSAVRLRLHRARRRLGTALDDEAMAERMSQRRETESSSRIAEGAS
jgi:RNA polymerase sigma factor (sigma-70 family)